MNSSSSTDAHNGIASKYFRPFASKQHPESPSASFLKKQTRLSSSEPQCRRDQDTFLDYCIQSFTSSEPRSYRKTQQRKPKQQYKRTRKHSVSPNMVPLRVFGLSLPNPSNTSVTLNTPAKKLFTKIKTMSTNMDIDTTSPSSSQSPPSSPPRTPSLQMNKGVDTTNESEFTPIQFHLPGGISCDIQPDASKTGDNIIVTTEHQSPSSHTFPPTPPTIIQEDSNDDDNDDDNDDERSVSDIFATSSPAPDSVSSSFQLSTRWQSQFVLPTEKEISFPNVITTDKTSTPSISSPTHAITQPYSSPSFDDSISFLSPDSSLTDDMELEDDDDLDNAMSSAFKAGARERLKELYSCLKEKKKATNKKSVSMPSIIIPETPLHLQGKRSVTNIEDEKDESLCQTPENITPSEKMLFDMLEKEIQERITASIASSLSSLRYAKMHFFAHKKVLKDKNTLSPYARELKRRVTESRLKVVKEVDRILQESEKRLFEEEK